MGDVRERRRAVAERAQTALQLQLVDAKRRRRILPGEVIALVAEREAEPAMFPFASGLGIEPIDQLVGR
jgi:hypothetical protein